MTTEITKNTDLLERLKARWHGGKVLSAAKNLLIYNSY